jgi:oligopeptide transport system permease protein
MDIENRVRDDAARHIESISTSGAMAPFPPTDAQIQSLGPLADAPVAYVGGTVTFGEQEGMSPLRASLRRLRSDRRAMTSLVIVVLVIVLSYLGPILYTHIGPTIQGGLLGNQNIGPGVYHNSTYQDLLNEDGSLSALHPLGTDQLGRDILARLMAGVNVSIEVAGMVIVFDIGLGILIGVLAGYFGGWIDTLLARFTDIMFAFPGLLFAILAAATLGPAFSDRFGFAGRLILVSLALGITIWPQMARYVRGQTLQLKEQQFVEAARTVGTSAGKLILRHIVPNLADIVVVAATLDLVTTIIGEATISLLGLGVQPPGSSLGLMISDATHQIPLNPLEAVWPTLTLALIVLTLSFVGDGVRDAFDPRAGG